VVLGLKFDAPNVVRTPRSAIAVSNRKKIVVIVRSTGTPLQDKGHPTPSIAHLMTAQNRNLYTENALGLNAYQDCILGYMLPFCILNHAISDTGF
jgi:hypothetical protein